jgi:hypothetical protein
MRKARALRLARLLGLTLTVWPFVGSGGATGTPKDRSLQLPEVGRCQAAQGTKEDLNSLVYNANNERCEVGAGGCDFFQNM